MIDMYYIANLHNYKKTKKKKTCFPSRAHVETDRMQKKDRQEQVLFCHIYLTGLSMS